VLVDRGGEVVSVEMCDLPVAISLQDQLQILRAHREMGLNRPVKPPPGYYHSILKV
jgi:hypothetical protein